MRKKESGQRDDLARLTSLETAQRRTVALLMQISRLYIPGMKLTLLVRHPHIENADGDQLFTRDDLDAVVASIATLRHRGTAGVVNPGKPTPGVAPEEVNPNA